MLSGPLETIFDISRTHSGHSDSGASGPEIETAVLDGFAPEKNPQPPPDLTLRMAYHEGMGLPAQATPL